MILFDSGPLLAYVNDQDPRHESAVEIMTEALKGAYGKLVVTNYVIDEVLTLATVRTKSCKYGEEILKTVREEKNGKRIFFELVLETKTIAKTEELFIKYCSKGLSFTDCSLLAVIDQLEIDYLFTFSVEFKGIAPIIPQIN